MKKILSIAITLASVVSFAQVGINTESPKTTFDVTPKMNGSSIDTSSFVGVQAPRLTVKELASVNSGTYGTDQKGALVYVTDVSDTASIAKQRVNVTIPGYYYFDGTIWQPITSLAGKVICEVAIGKNYGPESIFDIKKIAKNYPGPNKIKFQSLINSKKSTCQEAACKYTISIKGAGSWDKNEEGYVIPVSGIYLIQADVRIQDRYGWKATDKKTVDEVKAENIGFYLYAGPFTSAIKEVWTVLTPSSDDTQRQIVEYSNSMFLKKGEIVGVKAGHTSINQDTLGMSDATLKVTLIAPVNE